MSANDTPPEEQTGRSGGLIGKLVIGAVIAVVVGVETVVAFILTPDPADVARGVRDEMAQEYEDSHEDLDLVPADDQTPVVEVELGTFNITVHQPASEATYTISCTVMGTVAEGDQSAFEDLLEQNRFRLQEKIMIEFRNAELNDLTDSELGLIKRRILEKTNALFAKPLLRSVLLPDFNYYQQ